MSTVPAPEVISKRLVVRELIVLGPRANGTYSKADIPTSAGLKPAVASTAVAAALTGLVPGALVPASDGTLHVVQSDGAPLPMATEAYVDTATEDIPNITDELAAIVAENTDVVIPMDLSCRLVGAGEWILSRAGTALWVLTRTAAASPESAFFMAQIRQRTTASKGFKITGVRVKYKVATADLNDLTIDGNVTVMPATGSAVAAATALGPVVDGSYDTAHNTTAKRKAQGEHTMVVTFAAPIYLNGNAEVEIAVICDGTASGVLTINKISLLGAETLVDAA